MIFSLLVMVMSLFTACSDSDNPLSDTTKPVIDLNSPTEGQVLAIGSEHGVHFEMELSDDVMLKSYKIEIHNNFDHHSHDTRATGTTVDFTFNRSYDVSEQRTAHIHHHDIVIPANATPGDYHLMVYCTDAAGNELLCLCDDHRKTIPLSVEDKTAYEAGNNHEHLLDDISDEAFSELVADAPVLCRLIYCNIKMQYPQRKLAVYVAVSRHDSLTIRFHQVWTGEPPYYDPEDFSSGDERVFSVID